MDDRPELKYGETPGLRFACVLDGQGGCTELSWAEVNHWSPAHGVLWVHLERDVDSCQSWLRQESGVDPVVCEALLADESRPRVEEGDDALLVVLRGVNRNRGDEPIDLVPIHLWIDRNRVFSLRDKDHYLMALRDIREALVNGKGPRTTGDLFVRIAQKLVKYMEPVLEELEDEVDMLDHRLAQMASAEARVKLGDIRHQAIQLRRYLSPQREALFRLQIEDMSWLDKRDKIHLREVTDKVLRYVENLDAIRDRATILHEDLTAIVSEQISKTSNRLTLVAATILPPSLFVGLLGSNVEGIPGHDHPFAFVFVVLIVAAMFAAELWLLRKLKWL
jgi:zinc transporter